jgi:tetratricopeptide (TPR) repeat protein
VSQLLELLGKGLEIDLGELLGPLFWSPQPHTLEQLLANADKCGDLPELRLQIGLARMREGQIQEAIEDFSASLDAENTFVGQLALACAFEEKGLTYRTFEHLQAAHVMRSDEPAILYALGFAAERLGKTSDAAQYYRACIELSDDFLPARQRLAAVCLIQQDLSEAIDQYTVIRNAEPQQGWVRSALGQLLYRAGRCREAVEEFETAIAMEPENWALADDDVEDLADKGRVDQAVLELETAIEEQGPFPDLYVRLGDLLSQAGQDDEALKAYQSALDLQPNYLEAMVKIGTHHLVFGRWEEAAEAFYQAGELNDFLLINYVGTGAAYLAANKRDEAMRNFDLAAAVEPNSTLLMSEMARLQLKSALADVVSKQFEQGDSVSLKQLDMNPEDLIDKQISRHKHELQRHPQHADVRYRYAVLLRSVGRLEEAREQFQIAGQDRPPYSISVIKLGITLQEVGDIEGAIDAFRRAMDVPQELIEQHYRLGLLYTDRRRFEEAVREMEITEQEEGEPIEVRASLALSLQHMGLMDRAAAAWRSLTRMPPPESSAPAA